MRNNLNISFHEATVLNFAMQDGNITLELEEVNINGEMKQILLTCLRAQAILIDNVLAKTVEMPTKDGEVLTLNIKDNTLHAVIEWNDFINHSAFTKSYQIECKAIEMSNAYE